MRAAICRQCWQLALLAVLLLAVPSQGLSATQAQDWAAITAGVGRTATGDYSCSTQVLSGSGAFAVAVDGEYFTF
jgi:hypothetical protein